MRLEFYTNWETPQYIDEASVGSTDGLSTKLDPIGSFSKSYTDIQPRKATVKFLNNGWHFTNLVQSNDTIHNRNLGNTSYSKYKVRIFDGEDIEFTGVADLSTLNYDKKTNIISFKCYDLSSILFENLDHILYHQTTENTANIDRLSMPVLTSELINGILADGLRSMDGADPIDPSTANFVNIDIGNFSQFSIEETSLLDMPDLSDFTTWANGFRLDSDDILRCYLYYTNATGSRKYVKVYTLYGLVAVDDSVRMEYDPQDIENGDFLTTDSGHVFEFNYDDLSQLLIAYGSLATYLYRINRDDFAQYQIMVEGNVPFNEIVINDSDAEEITYDDNQSTRNYRKATPAMKIIDMARILLSIDVYVSKEGVINFTSTDDGTTHVLERAADTGYGKVLHDAFDPKDVLSVLKLPEDYSPLTNAVSEKYGGIFAESKVSFSWFDLGHIQVRDTVELYGDNIRVRSTKRKSETNVYTINGVIYG